MIARALFLLLFTLPALAQAGDLSIAFNSETRVAMPREFWYAVQLRWTGAEPARELVVDLQLPGTVQHVSVEGPSLTCNKALPMRCTMTRLRASDHATIGVQVSLPPAMPATYIATASITTTTPEAPASNNTATHVLEVAGLPDLRGSLGFRDVTIDPGAEGVLIAVVVNVGADAQRVILRVRPPGTVLSVEPHDIPDGVPTPVCTLDDLDAVCRFDRFPGNSRFAAVRIRYRAPDQREGGTLMAHGLLSSDLPDFNPDGNSFSAETVLRRMFVVTSAEDEGSGTLRQAILDARASCAASPCTIAFEGVTAIQPLTPLPELGGVLRIDGRTTHVELDGSRLTSGDGLLFTGGCDFEVSRMFIRDFPGHGIEARQTQADIDACHAAGYFGRLGLFVSHAQLSGNTRGIVVKGIDPLLEWNVVHRNRRAGVFIDGSYYAAVRNNVVVHNGASGIYVNTTPTPRYGGIPPGAEVRQNVVHDNGEWGVARTRNGLVEVRENSIARNALYGIDMGLDLSSIDPVQKPQLHSATYDAARNETEIRGVAPTGGRIDLYATPLVTTYPQGELYLGWEWGNGPFVIRRAGDLRGLSITATASVYSSLYFLRDDAAPPAKIVRPPTGVDTSELSDAVVVK